MIAWVGLWCFALMDNATHSIQHRNLQRSASTPRIMFIRDNRVAPNEDPTHITSRDEVRTAGYVSLSSIPFAVSVSWFLGMVSFPFVVHIDLMTESLIHVDDIDGEVVQVHTLHLVSENASALHVHLNRNPDGIQVWYIDQNNGTFTLTGKNMHVIGDRVTIFVSYPVGQTTPSFFIDRVMHDLEFVASENSLVIEWTNDEFYTSENSPCAREHMETIGPVFAYLKARSVRLIFDDGVLCSGFVVKQESGTALTVIHYV